MKIIIKKGEPLWTSEGYHLLDERGFAILSEELHKEIIITNPDAVERVKKSLPRERWDEIYLLVSKSSEQFLKDKEIEFALYEKNLIDTSIHLSKQQQEEEIERRSKEQQEKMRLEQELFDEEQKKIQAQRQAEFEAILKQRQEEEAAAVAKSEAEMVALKNRLEPIIAERKLREAEEAAAAEVAKKAQEQLITELLERIKNLEESK